MGRWTANDCAERRRFDRRLDPDDARCRPDGPAPAGSSTRRQTRRSRTTRFIDRRRRPREPEEYGRVVWLFHDARSGTASRPFTRRMRVRRIAGCHRPRRSDSSSVAGQRIRKRVGNGSCDSCSSSRCDGLVRVSRGDDVVCHDLGRHGSACRIRTPRGSSASRSGCLDRAAAPIDGERTVTFAADGSRRRYRLCRDRRRRSDVHAGTTSQATADRMRAPVRHSASRARCRIDRTRGFRHDEDLQRFALLQVMLTDAAGNRTLSPPVADRGPQPRRAERCRREPVRARSTRGSRAEGARAERPASCRTAALGRSSGG